MLLFAISFPKTPPKRGVTYNDIMTIRTLCLSFLLVSPSQAQSIADNWHQFRGPENNGVSGTANPPLEWSEKKNLLWKVALEGHGTSSPIVWGNKVFVLSAKNTGRVDPSLPKPGG